MNNKEISNDVFKLELQLWGQFYFTGTGSAILIITGNYHGNMKLNEQSNKWGQAPNPHK